MTLDQPTLEIDLNAIEMNYAYLQRACPAECGAVVKADAYGLGAARVSSYLASKGCRSFFVATKHEGITLRKTLRDETIYVLSGIARGEEATFLDHQLTPVLNSLDELTRWAAVNPPPGAAVHLDTGINRLGLDRVETAALVNRQELIKAAGVEILMTHYAFADAPDHPTNAEQLQRFKSVHENFPKLRTSIGNSAGLLNGPASAGDLARPGIGLYGGNPFSAKPNPMLPVTRLLAPIVQIKHLRKGDTVGYGGLYLAETNMRIGGLAIGYADGISRNLSADARVFVDGVACKILGRISMDTIVIDLSNPHLDKLAPGHPAEFIGATTLDQFSVWEKTFSYETLTSLGNRIKRVYK